jgi:hypothetical protein
VDNEDKAEGHQFFLCALGDSDKRNDVKNPNVSLTKHFLSKKKKKNRADILVQTVSLRA